MADAGRAPGDSVAVVDRRFRWRAVGVHMAISLAILAVLLYILLYHWFPGYLFDTDGGWQALRIIAGIDIVLGPLLTLVVTNPGKARAVLRKDYAVIGAVQALALAAGTWIAWESRPFAVIWYDDAFHSQPWSAFRDEPAAVAWLEANTGTATPHLVSAELPADAFARSEYFRSALLRNSSAMFDPRLYRPWPGTPARIRAGAALAQASIDGHPGRKAAYTAELARLGIAPDDVLPVPVASRYRIYFMLLDARTLAVRDIARVEPDPWFFSGLGDVQTRRRRAPDAGRSGDNDDAP